MKAVVFTDLDATLLDAETYSWAPATEAIEGLKARGASIVLVSSKTFAEMEPLHRELGLHDPFVMENGGGIVFSSAMPVAGELVSLRDTTAPIPRGDLFVLPLGVRYAQLVTALGDISRQIGLPFKGFAAMSCEEVASLTGLGIREAEHARTRDFDEPFVVTGELGTREHLLAKAARQRGLTVVQGGRFWHLMGHEGKGRAVSLLIEAYRRFHSSIVTLGLGDSPNDYAFLELVDIPVVLGGAAHGLILPDSLRKGRLTYGPGPNGWNAAILAWLTEAHA